MSGGGRMVRGGDMRGVGNQELDKHISEVSVV